MDDLDHQLETTKHNKNSNFDDLPKIQPIKVGLIAKNSQESLNVNNSFTEPLELMNKRQV